MKIRNLTYCFLLLLVIVVFFPACKPRKNFSFIQMCDPQLGMGVYEKDVSRFKQAVKQINELDVDFVVICGDLVHHASDSSFADFLSINSGFEMPSYLVPGNHDIGKIPNDSTLEYYRKRIGKDYYEFEHKGYAFIVTNSLLWKADVGDESIQHDIWFEKTISDGAKHNKPKIVIGHFPLYIDDLSEETNYFNFSLEKRKELLKLFIENNVEAYLSGHKHELVINNYKGIQLVSGETTSENFDKRPFGFRLWEIDGDSLRHSFIELQD